MLYQINEIQKVLFDLGHLCLLNDTKGINLTEYFLTYKKDLRINLLDIICPNEVLNFVEALSNDNKILLYVFLPQ